MDKTEVAAAFSTSGVKAAEAAEMMLRAVETGQARGLRELNIYVDLNKVTERAELIAQLHGKTLDENELKQVRRDEHHARLPKPVLL